MCLGTTVTCRSCRREAIQFYPGGRCGEGKPFPSWHRIRGHTRRIRRCHDCIQSRQRTLRRERENFIRDSTRAKSLRQYFQGERTHPLPDEELHLQSRGGYRLERFDLVDGDDGDEYGEELRFEPDEHPSRMRDETPSAETLSAAQEFEERYHSAMARVGGEASELIEASSQDLPVEFLPPGLNGGQDAATINYWADYQPGRRSHSFNNASNQRELDIIRLETEAHPETDILALILDRMNGCIQRQSDVDATGRTLSDGDQCSMFEYMRLAFDTHQGQAGEVQDEDYGEHEPPEISFYEWTIQSYQEDPNHNVGLSTQDALEEDLGSYSWYLQQYGTALQANDFRRCRQEIANRWFDFDHERLNGQSFDVWRGFENFRRGRRGMNQLRPIDTFYLYWDEVIWQQAEEVRDAYLDSQRHHFEENRRELYGHERDTRCPLIERLRGLQQQTWGMMAWSNRNYPQLVSVQRDLDRICGILRRGIAMEMEPTHGQWRQMLELGREAVREMRDAVERMQPSSNWSEDGVGYDALPQMREFNWCQLFQQLSQNSDHQFGTHICDVDDSDDEDECPPTIRPSLLEQDPRSVFSHGGAEPDWSSSEDEDDL